MSDEKVDGNRWVLDIEVMPNFFCVTFENYDTGEIKYFEISHRQNDLQSLRSFLYSIKYLIGFNSIHYDDIHLWMLLKESFLGVEHINTELYQLTQEIIEKDNYEYYKKWKYVPKELKLKEIDLYCFWSKGLRQSKKLSLKSIAAQMNFHKLQELPIKPGTWLTDEQMDLVKNYNYVDILVTKELLTRMREEVNLRFYIQKNYKVNCLSYDAPKIASEILANNYAEQVGMNVKDVRKLFFTKPTLHFNKLLEGIDFGFETKFFKGVYNDFLNAVDTFSKEYMFKQPNRYVKLSVGSGGLHSINKNEVYKTTDKHVIITSDIALT